MDSLNVKLAAAIAGLAQGVSGNSGLKKQLTGQTLNEEFLSTNTGGSKATNGYSSQRTLAGGANETLDLRNFTNDVNQTAQSLSKLRLFFIRHETTSAASSISVGNSGANALIILGCFGGTAAQLSASAEIIIAIPDTNGQTVDATHKDIKVVNNDGVNTATYRIGWYGE